MSWTGNNHGYLTKVEQDNMRRQSDIFLEQQRAFMIRDCRFGRNSAERRAIERANKLEADRLDEIRRKADRASVGEDRLAELRMIGHHYR